MEEPDYNEAEEITMVTRLVNEELDYLRKKMREAEEAMEAAAEKAEAMCEDIRNTGYPAPLRLGAPNKGNGRG